MSLVDTDWLEKHLDKVKIIDSTWHLPDVKRDGFSEYKKEHIKNSIFFDIDKNSKKKYYSTSHACKRKRMGVYCI